MKKGYVTYKMRPSDFYDQYFESNYYCPKANSFYAFTDEYMLTYKIKNLKAAAPVNIKDSDSSQFEELRLKLMKKA